jgi:hypothetical protein
MQVATNPARQARTNYRHELRTLTYVTLDEANGGIIRNLNHAGVAVQAVAPLREQQRVRLRFELRFPRLRVDTSGQVSWTRRSGQCGIHFVDLPATARQQIDEWIFSNLLESIAHDAGHTRSIFGASVVPIAGQEDAAEEDDGLTLSFAPRPVIRLEPSLDRRDEVVGAVHREQDLAESPEEQVSWLARPLSGSTLAWLADGLVVLAALLLFALVFLSIAHEVPPWPITLGTATAAAIFVAAAYRMVFAFFGGSSLGARLARAASSVEEEEEGEEAVRIR